LKKFNTNILVYILGDSYAKVDPQIWKQLKEEKEEDSFFGRLSGRAPVIFHVWRN
jgi:hypothetical protein